jgi:hypothetical protein
MFAHPPRASGRRKGGFKPETPPLFASSADFDQLEVGAVKDTRSTHLKLHRAMNSPTPSGYPGALVRRSSQSGDR